MKRLIAALLASAVALAPISANAVATQTTAALSSATWTDLGAGPLRLFGSSNTRYAISDSTPAAGLLGFAVGDTPIDVTTTSHVWVISASPQFNAFATYAPIASAATPTFSWPGNCGNVVIGAAPTAGCTAPVVNVIGTITASGPLGAQAIGNSQAVNPATSSVWPVSAAALPLPAGAATAANQRVTAAGTSDTSAQAVQGVTGGLGLPVVPGQVHPLSYCQLSVAGSAVSMSSCSGGIPTGATYALVENEGAAARWLDVNGPPTASVGQIIPSGTVALPGASGFSTTFSTVQFIAESGATILDITFYRGTP